MTRKPIADLREEMRAVARGERRPSPLPATPVLSALTPEALDLLALVLGERPRTIQDLARLTGRSQPNVSRSVQLLAKHGFLKLTRVGREVYSEPLIEEVRIDLRAGTCVKMPMKSLEEGMSRPTLMQKLAAIDPVRPAGRERA